MNHTCAKYNCPECIREEIQWWMRWMEYGRLARHAYLSRAWKP